MIRLRNLTLLAVILVFASITWHAHAVGNYKFRTLSPKGGFYYDLVSQVLQDNDGFIWIMMNNELQRFDGYDYKRFYPRFKELGISTNWAFNHMDIDSDGNLYISTNNGLFQYNPVTDGIKFLLPGTLEYLAIDKKDNIWFRLKNTLLRLDKHTLSVDTAYYNGATIRNIITSKSTDENIYFASAYGRVLCYDYEKKDISHICNLPEGYMLNSMCSYGDDLWLLATDKSFFKFNKHTGTVEQKYNITDYQYGRFLSPRVFHVDKNGLIWIGTQAGILVLDPASGEYRHFLHSETDNFSIPNNSVWTISEDIHRNLWIGTFSGGVCVVDLDENESLRSFIPSQSGINHNMISAFAEDGRYFWIGTEGGGLNRLDKTTGRFIHFSHSSEKNRIAYDNIKSLALDHEGNLWIAMYVGGLDVYNPETGVFTHYKYDRKDSTTLLANNLRKIIMEEEKGIWVAYQMTKSVISYFSFADRKFEHIYFDTKDNSYYIFDFIKNKSGLWILTSKNLYLMDPNDRTAENISDTYMDYLNGRCICSDNYGNIWIGTMGHGLLKYNVDSGIMEHFEDILIYDISTIYSICADDNNGLWLGTDNGLFLYNIDKNTYTRFSESDGAQGRVYYPISVMKSSSGDIYFGGTNGFTVVNPKQVKHNYTKPRAIISGFFINNTPALPQFTKHERSYDNNEILLKHNQANFGFKFSSDNYLMPGKTMFRYRLAGYDEQWITTDASNRTVYYSKVPPGSYTFEIAAANNDGIWGEILAVPIKRKPSPWLSWEAYIFYTLLVITILGTILYHYMEKKKLQMQLYIDNLDKQKKEEIHQSQLRFFTNISHDFRTPLSLIAATVDNLRKDGIRQYHYQILNGNTQRLLNLVNELMDFRTVENGKMSLQVGKISVNNLVRTIASDFSDFAGHKNITFNIICDPGLDAYRYADKQIIEKVIMNLLNNAFKYTSEGGRIDIETYSEGKSFRSEHPVSYTVNDGREPDDSFVIAVRDTGVGITEKSISTVFDRYYQVKTVNLDKHLGTGIGLALVKSLVLLHKGSITIYSERDKGTDMAVFFSNDPSIYIHDEFSCEADDSEVVTGGHNPPEGAEISDGKMSDVFLRDKKRVLIVEDNMDLRKLIGDFLSPHYEVTEAANGWAASKFLESHDTDLVISDIMMPLKDGVTLCQEIKSNVNTSHIPVILLTAKTGIEARLEGAGSGADIYFEKPADLNLLLISIQNVFKQQDNLRQYYAKNYFVDSAELSANEHDNHFLKNLIDIIDKNLAKPVIDVEFIASELSMSRSKLYSKLKTLTGKSIVEFILNYRMRKAARMIIEEDMSIKQVMDVIGIKSQSYFTKVFKNEFGDTPSVFAQRNKQKKL